MESWLPRLYVWLVSGMALYGCLGLLTLAIYWRHRRDRWEALPAPAIEWPAVTVQLPIYNERYVIARLLEAVVQLDYPREQLQIQVLDDSTDVTACIAAGLVAGYQAQGINIDYWHRDNRQGYKAGALAAGLTQASGDFIAIFDADFVPAPDFLRRVLPHFEQDAQLGAVQVRWEHLNPTESLLTAAQALALDKHFAVDQTVRFRADLFPKFNGSAGIWRRACLEDVGGWETDTVCEDLCLSTRAVLCGWRFRLLNHVVAPAELPRTLSAFKTQQARWAKGSFQCLIKFFWPIVLARQHSWLARLYALLSLSAYFTHVCFLGVVLLQLPIMLLDVALPSQLIFLSLAGLGQPLSFVLSQYTLRSDWSQRLRYFPALLIVAAGLAPSQARALGQVVWRYVQRTPEHHVFDRTPKGLAQAHQLSAYKLPFDRIILWELGFMLYNLASIVLAVENGRFASLPFLIITAVGMGLVAGQSLREAL